MVVISGFISTLGGCGLGKATRCCVVVGGAANLFLSSSYKTRR